MKRMDLNEAMSMNVTYFKIIGHWPFGNKKIYKFYTAFVMYGMHLYNVTGLIYLIQNLKNWEEVSQTLYNLISTIAAVIKCEIFHRNFDRIESVLATFERDEFQPTSDKQAAILKNGIFWAKFVFIYFCIVANFACTSWIVAPLFSSEKGLLPSKAWFPYNYLNYYAITYFWQSVYIAYVCWSNIGLDTFFAMAMLQAGNQLEALGDKISNVANDYDEDHPEILRANFGKCIAHHKMILELTETMGLAFGNLVFVQMATAVSVLCETTFLMSMLTEIDGKVFGLIFYEFGILVQIFLYCWYGNEIMWKSETLYNAAYSCTWYNCPNSFKKDVLFFMMRTQKPIVMVVGNMFTVSLLTFTNIIRSAWAYFMALRNVNEM